MIRSSVTYLSCSLFGSLSNRGFWRKSSFVHGNKSFDLGNVSADVDFKCTLWDIFTLRRGTLPCFFFFFPLFSLTNETFRLLSTNFLINVLELRWDFVCNRRSCLIVSSRFFFAFLDSLCVHFSVSASPPPIVLVWYLVFCIVRKSSYFWCGLSLSFLLSCSLQDTVQTGKLMSKSAVDYILLFQCSHIWGCEQRARRIGRPLKQIPEVLETIQVWDPFLSFYFLFRAVRALLSDFIFLETSSSCKNSCMEKHHDFMWITCRKQCCSFWWNCFGSNKPPFQSRVLLVLPSLSSLFMVLNVSLVYIFKAFMDSFFVSAAILVILPLCWMFQHPGLFFSFSSWVLHVCHKYGSKDIS